LAVVYECAMQNYGEKVRQARESKGISQAQLADEAGTTQQTIGKIEANSIAYSRYMPKIAQILGLDLREVDPRFALQEVASATTPNAMPVYPGVPGADRSMGMAREPAYFVAIPEMMFGKVRPFGCIMPDSSMKPIFSPGDVLLCAEAADSPPSGLCVLMRKDANQPVVHPMLVRKLVMPYENSWMLERENPHGTEMVEKTDWPTVYKIHGVYYQS